ncbi:hypothetical protein SGPA1_51059 [Streptomyces misionensis JCM 4497]
MVGVRRAQHRTHPGPVAGLVRRCLRRQRLQRGLPGHRIDHLADRAARLGDRRLRQPQQDALLAADPLELLVELALDLLLRPRVDLLHELDEQFHQRVCDLRLAHMAQRRQQRVPHRTSRRPQVRGVLLRRPRPPGRDQLLRHVCEQLRRQLQRPHPLELVHLRQQAVQPQRARVRLQFGEEGSPAARALLVRAGVPGDQVVQPGPGRRRQPAHGGRAEPFLEGADRRPHQPGDTPRRRRLQPVLAAAGHDRLRQPVAVQLHPAQLDRQPLGQLGLVLLGALTEAERAPDLHPVPLDRPPRPVVRGPLLGGHLHLLGDVRHRRRRDLLGVLREPGLHLEELQQQREPQPVSPRLVPQPLLVLLQQRPDLDQVLRLPLLPHPRLLRSSCHDTTNLAERNLREGQKIETNDKLTPDPLQRATCHFAAASGEQGLPRGAAGGEMRLRDGARAPVALYKGIQRNLF